MSAIIEQQLLKVELMHEQKTNAMRNMETSNELRFFRASGLRVEINLTRLGALVDVSNFSSVTLEVKQTYDPDGTLAMTKAGVIDATVTDAEHAASTPGRAHFTFEFSDAETAEGVFGATPADEVDHWAVLYGTLTGSGSRIVVGTGKLKSVDAGVSGAVVTPPSGGQAVTYAEVAALVAGLVPWDITGDRQIRFRKVGADGKTVTRTIGLEIDPDLGPVPVDSIEIEQ